MNKYQIKYGRRRTIAIHINDSGEVLVKAPYNIPQSVVLQFLLEKKEWIDKSLAKAENSKRYSHSYEQGDKFFYLGDQYPMTIDTSTDNVTFSNGIIAVPANKKPIKELIFSWFKKQSRFILKKKLNYWAEIMGLPFNSLKITSAKTRWGSCSNKGNVNFPFRIAMLPLPIIDYVVVHELSHIKELNHSMAFWKVVETYRPDYKKERKWLKDNSYKFVL